MYINIDKIFFFPLDIFTRLDHLLQAIELKISPLSLRHHEEIPSWKALTKQVPALRPPKPARSCRVGTTD